MLTTKIVFYKNVPIEYDDLGFWTIQYDGDDLVFNTLKDAKDFIEREMI